VGGAVAPVGVGSARCTGARGVRGVCVHVSLGGSRGLGPRPVG
jgi:hypothetical protein